MTQVWAPIIKNSLDQLVTQITAQWTDDKLLLTEPLKTEVDIFRALARGDARLKACSIRCFPPGGGTTFTAEPSSGLEGVLAFPCLLKAQGVDPSKVMDTLLEMQGLVVDGVYRDATLNAQVAGPAENPFRFGVIEADPNGGDVEQEIMVTFVQEK